MSLSDLKDRGTVVLYIQIISGKRQIAIVVHLQEIACFGDGAARIEFYIGQFTGKTGRGRGERQTGTAGKSVKYHVGAGTGSNGVSCKL